MGTSVSTPNGHCCCYHIQDDHATQFLTKVLTTKSYEIPDTKSYLFDEFFIRGKTSGKHTLEVCDDFGRGKLQQQKKSLSHDQMEDRRAISCNGRRCFPPRRGNSARRGGPLRKCSKECVPFAKQAAMDCLVLM